jgi:hypothetical protein
LRNRVAPYCYVYLFPLYSKWLVDLNAGVNFTKLWYSNRFNQQSPTEPFKNSTTEKHIFSLVLWTVYQKLSTILFDQLAQWYSPMSLLFVCVLWNQPLKWSIIFTGTHGIMNACVKASRSNFKGRKKLFSVNAVSPNMWSEYISRNEEAYTTGTKFTKLLWEICKIFVTFRYISGPIMHNLLQHMNLWGYLLYKSNINLGNYE